jgi:hypothetical protein
VESPKGSNVVRFSLVHGGPFQALLHAVHLARDDGRNALRQSVVFIALTWAPLVAFGLVQRVTTSHWSSLVLDPGVHARLLVSIPLLLVAEDVMHTRSERCIDRFVQSGLVSDGPGAVRRVVARAQRLRDSWLPEAAAALAAVATGQAAMWGFANPLGSVAVAGAAAAPSVAYVWWGVVSLPVAQFLLFRSLWRWALWSFVLWGLANLDVRPVALHPDRRGGLAFVGEPTMGFAIVIMSINCFVVGAWGGQMIFNRLPLQSFALPLSEITVVSFIITLGPLCVFSKCMWGARFAAIRQYDVFALTYARLFHEKWIDGGKESALGSSDIQSMSDLSNMLEIVRGMRFVPFGLYEAAAVLFAIGVPMVPLLLAAVPLHELLRRVAGVLLGALPG